MFHTQPGRLPLSVTARCIWTMGSTGAVFSKLINDSSLLRSTNQSCKLFSHCFPPLLFSLSYYHLSLSANQKEKERKKKKSGEFLDLLMKNVLPMSEMMSPWKLSQLNSPSHLLRTFKRLFGTVSVSLNHSACGLPVFFYSQVMIREGRKIEEGRQVH